MECDSEFRELANHNSFVSDLEQQGYHLDFINGFFAIFGVPYLDEAGALQHGDIFSNVRLNGWVIDPPTGDHQVWFRGGRPHGGDGHQLRLGGGAHQVHISDSITTDQSFSFKLTSATGQMRDYETFGEKIQTYLDAIVAPAMDRYKNATPLRAIEMRAADQGTSLKFPDSMSARYQINDIAFKLKGKSVAIVGLGGTGSYVLDFLAKTHLDRISLYDGDKIHVHTIFRIPGFIHRAIGRTKVDALAEHYSQMHAGIEPHSVKITETNSGVLDDFDFVFVCVDKPDARRLIVEHLANANVPFVDCGMGLVRSKNGLNGMMRITGVSPKSYQVTVGTPYLPTSEQAEDEYKVQPQIAELNSLNAALAVIRFKQHFGLFDLIDEKPSLIFETCVFEIDGLEAEQ